MSAPDGGPSRGATGGGRRGSATVTVAGLAGRYGLPGSAEGQLERLAERLAADPLAATAVRGPDAIRRDHLADSLVALGLGEVRAARSLADIGAGAGLPGLALAIALPETEVWLIESTRRKCEFLAATIASCDVANATVVCSRAEEWQAGSRRCDLVTARAVAPLAVVAEYAAPLLVLGGTLVVWRGRRDPVEEKAAEAAATELGLACRPPLPVYPYPDALHRHLHLFDKTSQTPARFPRRPGMARKRALGVS